jgi:nucleotide-binding universal stress UspA family protein
MNKRMAQSRSPARRRPVSRKDSKTVVVPVDFSKFSERALESAVRMAKLLKARLLLLYVIEPQIYPADYFVIPPEIQEASATLARAAQRRLDKLTARLRGQHGVGVETTICEGRPYEEISRVAGKVGAALIVIATHGYTGLKRAYLGSTAERVVRHAPCPVLVVR